MNYSKDTRKHYLNVVKKYVLTNPTADNYTYRDVLNYMEELQLQGITKNTKQVKLTAIKKYYDYLIDAGIREDHPCATMNLKGTAKKGIVFSDLFTMEELQSLLEREERYEHLKAKNKVVLSLLIYQAILPNEIITLKLHHIDVEAGTIYIKGGRVLTERKLEIHPNQYELIEDYLNNRKRLLYKEKPNDYFILNFQGNNDTTADNIIYLVETLKPRFQDRNLTTKAIRDSVIAYWLNERMIPLEQVQLIAGHRWISSTLRYRQESVKGQRAIVNKYHPLG
jgi:site-specific recombinase XerD